MSLRIGLVTDAHYALEDSKPKLCSSALPLLTGALAALEREKLSYFVDLGDRIDDRNSVDDALRAAEVAPLFHRVSVPRSHLMGNHDSYFLTADHWSALLCCRPLSSHVHDIDGYRLIFFCPDVNNERGKYQYQLKVTDLNWLRQQLSTILPCIIFSHVPLFAGTLRGNYYFEGTQGRAEYLNAAEARTIIAESNTILAVAGHVHWNTWHSIDGVHYITIQSLTESFTTHPAPAAAFAVLDIGEDIVLDVRGRDRACFRLVRRSASLRWLNR